MSFFVYLPFMAALTLCAESDLLFKLIPDMYIIFLFAAGLPLFIHSNGDIFRLLTGLFVLLIFIVFYNLLSRFIGGADLKLFALFVIIFGFSKTLFAFSFAFILTGIFALFYIPIKSMIVKKSMRETKKETLPLAPFLLISLMLFFM